MSRTTDIVVAGSGLAGLLAALAACRQGASVSLVTDGMGALAISGGWVDLLGYDGAGRRLENPWEGISELPTSHPYSLAGNSAIKSGLALFQECMEAAGWPMHSDTDRNILLPSIVGTLKPTYLVPQGYDSEAINGARRVLVVSVQGLRDCRPALIISQLRKYTAWADKTCQALILPLPFPPGARSVNALDLARYVERPGGLDWLLGALGNRTKNYDLVLIPPLCGSRPNPAIWEKLCSSLGCPVLEMSCIPPGVTGLRMREAIMHELHKHDFQLVENSRIVRAETQGGKCAALIALGTGREYRYPAGAFIIATGGILGGGITLAPGQAWESIFGLGIDAPEDVEAWSNPELFAQQPFAHWGVQVDNSLRPCSPQGDILLENVFFCGRILGAYDFASEKSGNGVAIATGWQAARAACSR